MSLIFFAWLSIRQVEMMLKVEIRHLHQFERFLFGFRQLEIYAGIKIAAAAHYQFIIFGFI